MAAVLTKLFNFLRNKVEGGSEELEAIYIKNSADFSFATGMTITIEPGIYIPGWGGMRIEDTMLITEDGFELLTNFPRDLMEI